jgi:hypothetical protein
MVMKTDNTALIASRHPGIVVLEQLVISGVYLQLQTLELRPCRLSGLSKFRGFSFNHPTRLVGLGATPAGSDSIFFSFTTWHEHLDAPPIYPSPPPSDASHIPHIIYSPAHSPQHLSPASRITAPTLVVLVACCESPPVRWHSTSSNPRLYPASRFLDTGLISNAYVFYLVPPPVSANICTWFSHFCAAAPARRGGIVTTVDGVQAHTCCGIQMLMRKKKSHR